jgi:IS30 family transposase
MGRSNSTISRELSRNTGNRGYRHKQANNLACEQYQQKNKHIRRSIAYIFSYFTSFSCQVKEWLIYSFAIEVIATSKLTILLVSNINRKINILSFLLKLSTISVKN